MCGKIRSEFCDNLLFWRRFVLKSFPFLQTRFHFDESFFKNRNNQSLKIHKPHFFLDNLCNFQGCDVANSEIRTLDVSNQIYCQPTTFEAASTFSKTVLRPFCSKVLGYNLQSEAVRLFRSQEKGSCWCGAVGTAHASDTIDLQFESHELRNFQIKKLLVYSLKRLEWRNRGREWPVKKVQRNK